MAAIAVITGATGGLGQEFVRCVLKENIDEIWAVARNEKRLNALKEKFGDTIRPVRCDLANSSDLADLFALTESEKPDIRLLINNAGIGKMGSSAEFPDSDVVQEIDINCKAVCLLCSHAIPFMKPGSRILNISSASSFQPVPYINLYAASKAFVRSYTRALNVELRSKGITCTAVCPGWIDTEMLEGVQRQACKISWSCHPRPCSGEGAARFRQRQGYVGLHFIRQVRALSEQGAPSQMADENMDKRDKGLCIE